MLLRWCTVNDLLCFMLCSQIVRHSWNFLQGHWLIVLTFWKFWLKEKEKASKVLRNTLRPGQKTAGKSASLERGCKESIAQLFQNNKKKEYQGISPPGVHPVHHHFLRSENIFKSREGEEDLQIKVNEELVAYCVTNKRMTSNLFSMSNCSDGVVWYQKHYRLEAGS